VLRRLAVQRLLLHRRPVLDGIRRVQGRPSW
jgi:hypothetical protein